MTAQGRPSVADLVYGGVLRTEADRNRASARYDRGALSPVDWRTTIADLHAREARWWAVLARATIDDHTIPLVYLTAVSAAQARARHEAADWTHAAAEYARVTCPGRVA